MRFRTGTTDDVATLWALRTRCVRETCSSHYPPEVIAPWSASPPPSQYARLLGQGGCVVAEDGQGGLLGFGVFDADANEVDALFVDPDRGGQGIGQALMQRLLAMADRGVRWCCRPRSTRCRSTNGRDSSACAKRSTRIPAVWRWLR